MRARDNVNNVGAWVESDPVEVGAAVTKYYSFNGQRVAMRQGDVVYYLNGDHPSTSLRTGLGSTSLTTDDTGKTNDERQVMNDEYRLKIVPNHSSFIIHYSFFAATGQRNQVVFGFIRGAPTKKSVEADSTLW